MIPTSSSPPSVFHISSERQRSQQTLDMAPPGSPVRSITPMANTRSTKYLVIQALHALGVVYGDIGEFVCIRLLNVN